MGKPTVIAVRVPQIFVIMMMLVGVSGREGRCLAVLGEIIRGLVRMPRVMMVHVGMYKLVMVAVAERPVVMMVPVRVSVAGIAAAKHIESEQGDGES
jgi:hypothetical protein